MTQQFPSEVEQHKVQLLTMIFTQALLITTSKQHKIHTDVHIYLLRELSWCFPTNSKKLIFIRIFVDYTKGVLSQMTKCIAYSNQLISEVLMA